VIEVARLPDWDLPREDLGLPSDAWAPSGSRLVLKRHDGIAIWDATRPNEPPMPILEAVVHEVRWSPDGTWLCCRVRIMNATRGGSVRLQFVSASGGEPEYRIPNAAIGQWLWADDGFVYFWDGESGKRRRVEPPRAWRDGTPALPRTVEPQLVPLPRGTGSRRQRVLSFTAGKSGEEPIEALVDSLLDPPGVWLRCRFHDAKSRAPRWVATLGLGKIDQRLVVVDAAGRQQSALSRSSLAEVRVADSGLWGLRVLTLPRAAERQGSDHLAEDDSCAVEVFSTSEDWSSRLEDASCTTRAQFDRASSLVAIATMDPPLVRIVRIEINPPPSR
jgi:hypothetical protein